MNGLPYFAFYASDFLSGVAAMPLEDRGAYITLLCHQWVNGSIPLDVAACVRICGGGTVSERVLDKFRNVDGTDTRLNARLEKERVKCMEAREKAKKRKTKWKERCKNACGTRSGTVPDTSMERLGSDSDSHTTVGSMDAPSKPKPKERKELVHSIEAMPAGFESLLELFNDWLEARKNPATAGAVKIALQRVQEWGLVKAQAILSDAVVGRWDGLKDYGNHGPSQGAGPQKDWTQDQLDAFYNKQGQQ